MKNIRGKIGILSHTKKQSKAKHLFVPGEITKYQLYFFMWTPRSGKSLFSITFYDLYFSTNTLIILQKYCQMAPPHKIDASNDASPSFSFCSCLLFFSDCYCSDWWTKYRLCLILTLTEYMDRVSYFLSIPKTMFQTLPCKILN